MAHPAPGDFKDVILFLATAGVVVPLFRRWRISPILGFLVAGVLLGPSGLGALGAHAPWAAELTINSPKELAQLGELGVVFLMFMIGLELSWARLWLMRRYVFGLGALQVVGCGLIVALTAYFFGASVTASAAVGAAMALSSTAVVMPILTENRRQHVQAGRVTFAVLLFQDLAVAPILITLAIMGRDQGPALSPEVLASFAPAVLAVAALVGFGRFLLRPMMRSVARARSDELFMAACLLVVIGSGLLAAFAGLSMALGAFVAGLLLAETEFRHEVEQVIEPFKGLLLGLFFLAVGIGLDVGLVLEQPLQIAGVTFGLMALNSALIFGLARAFGLNWKAAAETALLLAASGEFAFVILASAMDLGVVPEALGQSLLVSATLSMMCIPLLAALGLRIAGRATSGVSEAPHAPGAAPDGRILLVGFGRVGRLVGEMLDRHGLPWSAIDQDASVVARARKSGRSLYFGDASRPGFLERCGLGSARALVITADADGDDVGAVETLVASVRDRRPDLAIFARARDSAQALRLYEMGVTDAVPETVEASLQLSEAVLVGVGTPVGPVIASIHARRDEFRRELNQGEGFLSKSRQKARVSTS
ncbi:cation:proton antiporter [Phenylobacterium parvum]|uniref:Potassium transporter TrkA n=1 Tax=Phenylobacterium parvum TaxID=2201350 RepID=A0A2Z3HUX1_9CAUL|nr:cation:proton antiporter [Phenylobacterium parvum]AWM76489.1 potassium transporter TrkA [Phenylobacterium parvum]